MSRERRPATFVVAVLAVIALAGCGGSGEEGQTSDQPVEDQLGFEAAQILERQRKVEDLIRDCMKAKGFEYTPVDPAAQQAALTGSANLSDEDFQKQFGYGITTLYEQRLKVASTGANATYRASLPAAQQSAYDTTLFGQNQGVTFSSAVDTGDFTGLGGCTKEATDQSFGGAQTLATLQTKLDELDERIAADARMVEAVKEWSDCMRSAGFSGLKEPDEVDSRLEERLEAIVGPTPKGGIPPAGRTYDKAALAELQKEEVKLVAADVKCEEEHIEEVDATARKQYEKTFQEENAALLQSIPKP